jgi:hypothetical protein
LELFNPQIVRIHSFTISLLRASATLFPPPRALHRSPIPTTGFQIDPVFRWKQNKETADFIVSARSQNLRQNQNSINYTKHHNNCRGHYAETTRLFQTDERTCRRVRAALAEVCRVESARASSYD